MFDLIENRSILISERSHSSKKKNSERSHSN